MLPDNFKRKDICQETSICLITFGFIIFTGLVGSLSWCTLDLEDYGFGTCFLYKFGLIVSYIMIMIFLFIIGFMFVFTTVGFASILMLSLYSIITCSYNYLHNFILFLKRIIIQCCMCSGDFCKKEIRLCHDNMITRKLRKLGTPYEYINDEDI